MRFRPGSVSVATVVPEDEGDYCDTFPIDARQACGQPVGSRIFSLPHQCDAWLIGTEEDVRALIRELQEKLDTAPNFD